MKEQVLIIRVTEKVNVSDIFITARKWIERHFKMVITTIAIFYNNIYRVWRAVFVRGPDVNKQNKYEKLGLLFE